MGILSLIAWCKVCRFLWIDVWYYILTVWSLCLQWCGISSVRWEKCWVSLWCCVAFVTETVLKWQHQILCCPEWRLSSNVTTTTEDTEVMSLVYWSLFTGFGVKLINTERKFWNWISELDLSGNKTCVSGYKTILLFTKNIHLHRQPFPNVVKQDL